MFSIMFIDILCCRLYMGQSFQNGPSEINRNQFFKTLKWNILIETIQNFVRLSSINFTESILNILSNIKQLWVYIFK